MHAAVSFLIDKINQSKKKTHTNSTITNKTKRLVLLCYGGCFFFILAGFFSPPICCLISAICENKRAEMWAQNCANNRTFARTLNEFFLVNISPKRAADSGALWCCFSFFFGLGVLLKSFHTEQAENGPAWNRCRSVTHFSDTPHWLARIVRLSSSEWLCKKRKHQ